MIEKSAAPETANAMPTPPVIGACRSDPAEAR